MPQGVDFGLVSFFANKWIVVRNTTVISNSQDFAAMVLRILRLVAAVDYEKSSVTAEGNSRRAGAHVGNKDIAHIGECLAVPASTGYGVGGAFASIERLCVGEIDELVFRKSWMQRDIHQTVDGAW